MHESPRPAPAPTPIEPFENEFLLHSDSGELIARSPAGQRRVLAPQADFALYDPNLELLWFVSEDELRVLDLRDAAAVPVRIAREMPVVDRLVVQRGHDTASTEDPCDSVTGRLEWSATPTLEVIGQHVVHIDDGGWLKAQLQRPARATGARRSFATPRVSLPSKLKACDDKRSCGTQVAFGARASELVLVVDQPGGDCRHRACVLHDPKTGLFATPPQAAAWGAAKGVQTGPCGLYFFDAEQSSFLMTSWLCTAESGCSELHGIALGWRLPGDTIGESGNFED